MVRGSNAGGGEIFLAFQTDPNARPASCTWVLGLFSERGADHPRPSVLGCEFVAIIFPSLLCACLGMSWGDFSGTF